MGNIGDWGYRGKDSVTREQCEVLSNLRATIAVIKFR